MPRKVGGAQRTLRAQRQMFLISGHLDQDVDGNTSWTFVEYADNGTQACRQAVATAAGFGLKFTMELCVYGRGPRIRRGPASYGRVLGG